MQGNKTLLLAQGLKTIGASWFCTGVIRLIGLVLVLYIWIFTRLNIFFLIGDLFLSRKNKQKKNNVGVVISFRSYLGSSLFSLALS